MRLEQFEYLEAVAERGSMSAAAQHLHISQQNISKAIKQLEDELKITAFVRSKKGVCMTDQGELVYSFAKKQLEQYRLLKDNLQQIQLRNLQGTLRICTMNSGSSMIVPQMLCEFYKKYPNVVLEITADNLFGVIDQIVQKKADLGIITYTKLKWGYYPEIPEELRLVSLLKGKPCYWVSKNAVYAQKGFMTLAETNKETILLDNAIDAEYLADLYAMQGLIAHTGLCSQNLHLLSRLISDGQGVFPDVLFSDEESLYSYVFGKVPEIVAVPLKSDIEFTGVGYLIREEHKMDMLLSHTVQFLSKSLEGSII